MNLYRGLFKFPKGPIIIYRHAASEKQAWLKMCIAIAKKQGVDQGVVCRHFDYEKKKDDNFEIKIETEFTEEDG